jgi:iron(III) transport system permease protein
MVIGILAIVTVLLPLTALIIQSASINAYLEAFTRAWDSLLRSFAYAVLGALAITILGFFLGYLIHTRAVRFWRGADSLTLFLFAMPSPVIGIGLISLWNTPSTNFIYATPVIITLGYLAQYTARTSRITVSTLTQLSPAMDEAAEVEGAGWFQRIRFIVAPMAKPGLVGGWLVACIFCLRDTGLTMMVYPPGQDT